MTKLLSHGSVEALVCNLPPGYPQHVQGNSRNQVKGKERGAWMWNALETQIQNKNMPRISPTPEAFPTNVP